MSDRRELVALVCCDLGAIVRGRSLFSAELAAHLQRGVGWVPANHALTPLGPLAEPNPFGSTGDLRLLPDPDTRVRVSADAEAAVLELLLCDIVETDGAPVGRAAPARFLRDALARARARARRARCVRASSTSSSCSRDAPPALPFSLEAQRSREPFATRSDGAPSSRRGSRPSASSPSSRRTSSRSRSSARRRAWRAPTARRCSARSCARSRAAKGCRASFAPLLDPAEAGNGVHIHLTLLDGDGPSAALRRRAPRLPERARRAASRPGSCVTRARSARSPPPAPSPPRALRRTAGARARSAWRSRTARRCCGSRRW